MPDGSEVLALLLDVLGWTLTAYLAGLDDTSALMAPRRLRDLPAERVERLEAAFSAASVLLPALGGRATRAWFLGRNEHLSGRAPAEVLRTSPQDAALVVGAAKADSWG